MTLTVFAVVLLAAALHATWNAIVKGGADKDGAMCAVVLGQGLAGAVILPFAPVPVLECWPYLMGGLVLHLGYQLFLLQAYKVGDLTQVYPIARGVSPLLVAMGSAFWLGAQFERMEIIALVMMSVGIASISLTRSGQGIFQRKAAILAVGTGCFIASYSLVDGQGARIAGTALGFYCWLSTLNAVGFALLAALFNRGMLVRSISLRKSLYLGGGASFTAYALVVWAFTQAPMALVTALRETSIIFALLIGVGLLGERLNLAKVVSTAITLSGAILLRLQKGA